MEQDLTLAQRVSRLEALVLAPGTPPTLRELLAAWPGGRAKLSERINYSTTALNVFSHARHEHFPVVMAGKIANAFQRRGIEVYGRVTVAQLRAAWLLEKKTTTTSKEVSDS